jgi:SOS response regulatory protein OraA/RecX
MLFDHDDPSDLDPSEIAPKEKKEKKKYVSKREWMEQQLAKPVTLDDVKRYAFYLLERQDYTSGRLFQKMNENFRRDTQFNQQAIDYFVDKNYVDDEAFLVRMVESLMRQDIGIGKIREKLYNKKFSGELVDKGISLAKEKDFLPASIQTKQKKYGDDAVTDQKLKQKALGFMVRKGFDFALSRKVLESSVAELEEELEELNNEFE